MILTVVSIVAVVSIIVYVDSAVLRCAD